MSEWDDSIAKFSSEPEEVGESFAQCDDAAGTAIPAAPRQFIGESCQYAITQSANLMVSAARINFARLPCSAFGIEGEDCWY